MLKQLFHLVGRSFISVFLSVQRVPKIADSQCIVVSNHNSHLDVMILFRLFEINRIDRVRTVAAADYFGRGAFSIIVRWTFNTVLIKRGGMATHALGVIKGELAKGNSVIMFPEGTRGKPGVIESFKAGAGMVAVEFPDMPVYPVYLAGAEKALPRGSWLPVPFDIEVRVLEPVRGRDFHAKDAKESARLVTAEIERRIREQDKK